ncbi:hypothetical protein [Martelella sp. AD-3]|uniref:hypothetical protein n=1 Tax=Martelella sp. AD-3 TaxID=686597 RepID=UPI000464DBD4|nr:hypothetical protein [Martelella sp. AD-3]AMM83863.1 hypothetical protein AZF01_05415 [Martelella sp. AD-3]
MKIFPCAAAALFALSQPILAQETATGDAAMPADEKAGLSISLNALDTTDNGCKLTFLVENNLSAPIDSLQAEVALFDTEGVVDRLTMLDFLSLPAGKMRVRQFELPGAGCDALGGLLLNDLKVCEVAGADCMAELETGSKAGIPFDG